jgi:phosphohistidine phosphatase SixA
MTRKIVFIALLLISTITFSQENASNNDITKIIILRHAEKMVDGSKNPSLSEIGKMRAIKLKDMLADIKIDKLFSTPYLRTKQTLEPLSISKNLPISDYNPSDKSFAENLILQQKGKTVVIAGHSNSSPELVNSLLKYTKFSQLDEMEYGKLWIITFKNEQLIDCVLLNY